MSESPNEPLQPVDCPFQAGPWPNVAARLLDARRGLRNYFAGRHLVARRGLYTHHGISLGDGTVVHFTGEPLRGKATATVTRTTLATFRRNSLCADADEIDRERLKAAEAITPDDDLGSKSTRDLLMHLALHPGLSCLNALAFLGQGEYSLGKRNCEHLATFCASGVWYSAQLADALLFGPSGLRLRREALARAATRLPLERRIAGRVPIYAGDIWISAAHSYLFSEVLFRPPTAQAATPRLGASWRPEGSNHVVRSRHWAIGLPWGEMDWQAEDWTPDETEGELVWIAECWFDDGVYQYLRSPSQAGVAKANRELQAFPLSGVDGLLEADPGAWWRVPTWSGLRSALSRFRTGPSETSIRRIADIATAFK